MCAANRYVYTARQITAISVEDKNSTAQLYGTGP